MRNYSAYLNQSLLIHNMHLVRRMQQFLDYFLSLAGEIHEIEELLASGDPNTVLRGQQQIKKIRIELDSLVLSMRGTSQPPTKEDMLAFSGSFVQKPKRRGKKASPEDIADIEDDIKKILDTIFGGMKKDKDKELPPPVKWIRADEEPPPTAKDKVIEEFPDDLPDPEDLEDFLKGL